MQPVLIIQEVLSDLKLNFPVIPDLCNHARCREIICGWASQELRLGGETCLAWDQRCLQEIEKRRGEIISKYCQHQTLIPPNQHHRKKPPPVFFYFPMLIRLSEMIEIKKTRQNLLRMECVM